MISIDDFLKMVLVFVIAFAVAGISLQIMRLISKLTSLMEEVRQPIRNVSTLSDYALEDYNEIRKYIKSLGGILNSISNIFSSLNILNLLKKSSRNKGASE